MCDLRDVQEREASVPVLPQDAVDGGRGGRQPSRTGVRVGAERAGDR